MDALERIVDFAFSVLLGGDGREEHPARRHLHYGPVDEAPAEARLVIRPSGFLAQVLAGDTVSRPALPLREHDGVPVLFGDPGVTRVDGRLVLDVDVVAAAYFLLTRYEELLRPEVRDDHGRFPGKESLLGQAGLVDRPVVDECGKLVRRLLREGGVAIAPLPAQIRRVYLTHDLDRPFAWHRLRPALGECARRIASGRLFGAPLPLLSFLGLRRDDPHDCFDWIFEADRAVADALGADRVVRLYFVMAGGAGEKDGRYEVASRPVRRLLRRIRASGAELGLHASYEAGRRPELIPAEADSLREVTGEDIEKSRHHFLGWREPRHYRALLEAGIRDDFTMTFADLAGFRLGTSRPFFWFDAEAQQPTDLRIHPTTVMECTLDDPEDMNLGFEEARAHCLRLVEATRAHHGDLTLLWHNTELSEGAAARGSYQRALYQDLLNELTRN